MAKPTLLIFAKPPRIGLSKTRLADGLGRTQARRIARFTLARTMMAVRGSGLPAQLHVTPRSALADTLGGLWPDRIERRLQRGQDLGERMAQAMRDAPYGPVIFIGADAPGINQALLKQGARALRRHGAVFGPAEDGGFWLLGLCHSLRDPSVFEGVRWSSVHAMEDVWSNLPQHARISLLPQLIDIDVARDWKLYKKQR